MSELLTRREFIQGAASLTLAAFLTSCGSGRELSPIAPTPDRLEPGLEWEQRKQFLLEMKKYQDSLPSPEYRTSTDWIIRRTQQLEPYFQSQQIVDQVVPVQQFQPMQISGLREEDQPSAAMNCTTATLNYNEKIDDPRSNFSKSPSGNLALLAHESYHLQSQCAGYSGDNREASAQIISLSILAGIANDSSADKDLAMEAKRGVAEALVKWDHDSLFYEALQDPGKREDYIQFAASTFGWSIEELKQVFSSYDKPELAQAKLDKEASLYRYSVLPYQLFTVGVSKVIFLKERFCFLLITLLMN